MKKISLMALAALLASSMVSANMMGDRMYSMMGENVFGFGFLWLIGFAMASLVFSLIFWYTYNLVAKKR